ncbi:MAG: TonB-dependent receptor [Terriglobia bacterium]
MKLLPWKGKVTVFVFIFMMLWASGRVLASQTATLTGRVTDSLGGVLHGVQIEATSLETNTVFQAKANKDGLYRISNLPPGSYRVIVRMFGFRTIVKPGVKLHVQDIIALNFSMQVGSAISSITEKEGVPLIQAETAMQSTTVNQLTLGELPSLTRNPYDFVSLIPGANQVNANRGIGFSLNGQRLESGSFLLDGSDNNEPYQSGPGLVVPLDAVQEYRLMTNSFTAEYGRNVGYIANVLTKSGTNDVQGDVYYFNRNSALASNTYENKARGNPKPVFNRNQFGGSIGGPIVKDKLFYFLAVEPIIVRSSASVSYYVPTPQLLAVSSPGTNAIFRNFPLPANLSATDISTRTVCPFGRGCGSKISSGFVTIPAFAATSLTGPIDAGAGAPQDTTLWTARVDYTINERMALNARYGFQNSDLFPTVSQPYAASLDQGAFVRNQNVTLNFTRFWSGNFLTESRFVFYRLMYQSSPAPSTGYPSYSITGDAISGSAGTLSLPSGKNAFGGPQNNYQFYQGASWIRGKHNLKFGGQFFQLRDNQLPYEVPITRNNLGEFRNVQDFVDGFLSSYQILLDPKGHVPGETILPPYGPPALHRHLRFNDVAAFFQDTWKLTPRLTLSPGLRYEYFGEGHRTGSEAPFDTSFYTSTDPNPYLRIANGMLLRTLDAPGNYQGHYYIPDRSNFGPRMGIAYDLDGTGKTVLRAGGGLFFDRLNGFAYDNLNPPAFSLTRLQNFYLNPASIENPYTVFPSGPMAVPPSAIVNLDQNLRTAKTYQWNITLEHELHRNFVVGASYVGSTGNQLYRFVNTNRIGSGEYLGRPGERIFNTVSGISTINNDGFSNYQGLQLKIESFTYQSLGLQFGANYTYSHSLDNVSSLAGDTQTSGGAFPLDAFNTRLDKASSDFDVRQRFVGYFVWQIPSPFHANGFKKDILGGWEFSGILSFQTGQPFSLSDNLVVDRDLGDNTRPRIAGPLPQLLADSARVSDARTPNAFLILPVNAIRLADGSCDPQAAPLSCQPSVNGPFDGSLGRNTFRQPGAHFENFALMKNVNLSGLTGRESMRLQFRVEVYNLLNHSNLYLRVDTGNVAAPSFNVSPVLAVPGVVASYGTPFRLPQEARQIVLAVKLNF